MTDQIKPTTLLHGSNIITKHLKLLLSPIGFAYQFEPGPPYRPKPLTILVLLLNFSPVVVYIGLIRVLLTSSLPPLEDLSDQFKAISASVFIFRVTKILWVVRLMSAIFVVVFTLTQHGCISSVIASGNNYLTEKEQSRYAKMTLAVFFLYVLSNTAAYPIGFLFIPRESYEMTPLSYAAMILSTVILFWGRLHFCTPLIFSCYLTASLGKHVENFSSIYIDTMFDQFMRAIEKEGDEETLAIQLRPLPFFDSASDDLKLDRAEAKQGDKTKGNQSHGILHICWRHFIALLTFVYNLCRNTVIRLSMRRYPELPEMKMTKLSSTTKIQISERTRVANNHLIRVRLRRTQVMISDLRDLVSDINRTSSPILMIHLLYETIFIVFVTTASVQGKVYKSLSVLILPTVFVTSSLVFSVVYVCVCYDQTTKQLRLLINKLFDFIIMNHRVQSSGRTADRPQVAQDTDEACILPGSETGAINETWSQFQYTRKLANTIQFTMGGIVPVTRRLVLSILGHILSAVFISIEIMSIIDTMNTPNTEDHTRSNFTAHSNHGHHSHHHSHHHHQQNQTQQPPNLVRTLEL